MKQKTKEQLIKEIKALRKRIAELEKSGNVCTHTVKAENNNAMSFCNMVEYNADGIVIVDRHGVVRFVNRAAEVFFNRRAKEFVGDLFGFPIVGGRTSEIDIVQKDGKKRMGEMRVAEIEWEGQPSYLASIRDITERKEIDRLKDEFIGTVSHELRTPMTTIRETVSQILDGILGETTEEQREFLSICIEDIDRLKRITDNLLNIAKIKAGKVEIKKDIVDMVGLAEMVTSHFYAQAKEKNLEIRKVFPRKRVELYADEDKVIQVFTNLIGNAVKFTQEGHIEVGISDAGKEVECYVSDTGIGISEENLPHVFGEFQQFARLPGPGEKGTGLGLSISKSIVEMHRGKIWAESRLNEGSKFTFTLPKLSAEEILYDGIENRIMLAQKEHKEFSVFIVRLDNYAEAKRKLGEKKMQKALRKILDVKEVLREEEFVAAKGKDEVVILADVNSQNAAKICERIRNAIKESLLEVSEKGEISFSLGYSTYLAAPESAKDLLKKAEDSLVSG